MRVNSIGIDIDFYSEDQETRDMILDNTRKRLQMFGTIMHDKQTKHGWHFKIRLIRPVGFWRSIDIRYFCGDDIKRMFYDIRRYRHGGKIIDVLFDKKTIIKRQKNNK